MPFYSSRNAAWLAAQKEMAETGIPVIVDEVRPGRFVLLTGILI